MCFEICAKDVAIFGFLEREHYVEFFGGACIITKDIADGHEEREQIVVCSHLAVITDGKVANEGTTWSLQYIIGHIQYPEINDVANEEDDDCDCNGAKEDERAAATKIRMVAIIVVAGEWLDECRKLDCIAGCWQPIGVELRAAGCMVLVEIADSKLKQ
ncbi:unnamed protein product [Trifolium pratense]|uniref:Uncharacterized protein n=1 Tax=Trifolium pratense TaxID=57577 RepID=A0ACB0LI54_TRIPR|nr:unnamed protein product [Trifolium pratense]